MTSPTPIMPQPADETMGLTPAVEEAQRARVVAEARSWLGTPYRQLGDTKGASIDCAMLLVRCWVDAGVFKPFDPRPYPPEWHMHKSEERYLAWMEALACEVAVPRPGDIALYRYGLCFSHGGVMVTPTRLVHASAFEEDCTMSELSDVQLARQLGKRRRVVARPVKFFDVWAKVRQMQEGAA